MIGLLLRAYGLVGSVPEPIADYDLILPLPLQCVQYFFFLHTLHGVVTIEPTFPLPPQFQHQPLPLQ